MKRTARGGQTETEKKGSSLSIIVHQGKCIGCGACETACSTRRTGRNSPEGSAIRVGRTVSGRAYVPLMCAVCTETTCAAVCPGDVLSRERQFGVLALRTEGCSSCSSCILSCPFGVLHMGERRQVPRPCDLCEGAPECVKSCPTGALECVDLSDKKSLVRKQASMKEIAKLLTDVE